MVFAEGDFDVAEGIESAAIDTDVLLQSFEDESAFVERWLRFSGHGCALRESFHSGMISYDAFLSGMARLISAPNDRHRELPAC